MIHQLPGLQPGLADKLGPHATVALLLSHFRPRQGYFSSPVRHFMASINIGVILYVESVLSCSLLGIRAPRPTIVSTDMRTKCSHSCVLFVTFRRKELCDVPAMILMNGAEGRDPPPCPTTSSYRLLHISPSLITNMWTDCRSQLVFCGGRTCEKL